MLCAGSDVSLPHLQGLSFIIFGCYVASSASAFLTAPLLEFLLALFFLFADAMQLNDKWQGLCWPMMVRARAPGGRGWLAITLPSVCWRGHLQMVGARQVDLVSVGTGPIMQ